MQAQQMTEPEIIKTLREQGYNPAEISRAIEQSKIKQAISSQEDYEFSSLQDNNYPAEQSQQFNSRDNQMQMAQEISDSGAPYPNNQQGNYSEEEYQQSQDSYMQQPQEQGVYENPREGYGQGYTEYQPYGEYQQSPEVMTEIAEQITNEKIEFIKKELASFSDFKTRAAQKLTRLDERMKRIEDIIDRLQATILGKVGSYIKNIADMKKELEMMQDSFSKLVSKTEESKIVKKKTSADN